jgi:hypothetical protein
MPDLSKYEHIVVDRITYILFFKLLFCRHVKSHLSVFYCENRRPFYLWFLHKTPFIKTKSMSLLLLRILCLLNKKIKINKFNMGYYPSENARSGLLGIQLTESIYQEWSRNKSSDLENIRKIFLGDSDVSFAYKKFLCGFIEDSLWKFLSFHSFCKKHKNSIFLLTDVENIYFLQLSFKFNVLNISEFTTSEYYLFNKFINRLNYILCASLLNSLSFMFLLIGQLFAGKVVLSRNNNKVSTALLFQNAFGSAYTKIDKDIVPLYMDSTFLLHENIFNLDEILMLGIRKDSKGRIDHKDEYDKLGLRVFDYSRRKISFVTYISLVRMICLPSIVLQTKALFSLDNSIKVSLLPPMLRKTIDWIAICEQVNYKVYLDVEEHSYNHIIQIIVSRKYGADVVFFPHGVFQKYCSQKAFLVYSLFLSPGKHFILSYGKYCKQDVPVAEVGIMRNDGVASYGKSHRDVSSYEFEELIKNIREKKQSIVGFVFGSIIDDHSLLKRYEELLHIAVDTVKHFSNVTALIKPKGTHGYYFRSGEFYEIISSYVKEKKIFIVDGTDDIACNAQSLALATDACVSVSGFSQSISTAWIEAVALGKPSFAYDPIETTVGGPLLDKFYGKYIFRSGKEIINELEQVILQKDFKMKEWELIKEYFDPFCDGKSTKRILMELRDFIDNKKEFIRNHKTVKEVLYENKKLIESEIVCN